MEWTCPPFRTLTTQTIISISPTLPIGVNGRVGEATYVDVKLENEGESMTT